MKAFIFFQSTVSIFGTLLVALITIGISVVVYLRRLKSYWERRGLYTYYGNDSTGCITYKNIKERGHKHGAFICFYKSSYMPVNLDIIKAILVTDSEHFLNRGLYSNPKVDPLTGTLSQLTNGEWKNVRSIVSTIFSSSKFCP